MATVRMINASQVSGLLDPDALRKSLEEGLIAQSEGRSDVPPRIAATTPNGILAAMPGYSAAHGGVLATKLVSVFPNNRAKNLPSHMGLIALFDESTGAPLAIMDAEVITEMRTAGTAAIAADVLARPDASILTIVGAGAQAKAHVHAFATIRAWDEVRFVNRSQPAAVVLAAEAKEIIEASSSGRVAVSVSATFDQFEEAVRGSSVVALTTHAEQAVVEASWIEPGCHVSSVGSSAELPTELIGRGPLVVDQSGAVTSPPPAGAYELQGLDPDNVIELGQLLSGEQIGRSDGSQVTIYKSTGHAVQDLAAAHLVYEKALSSNVGSMVDL